MVTAIAFWLEIRPDPTIDHPFAVTDIAAGEAIGDHNTELRRVPAGLFDAPEEDAHALVDLPAGTPVLASQTGPRRLVMPEGWWVVALDVPLNADIGEPVRVILFDENRTVDGFVSAIGSSDGFTSTRGGVAVAPEAASDVAVAAAAGRLAVLLSTG
jgi:hypothetical protein